MRTSTTRPCSSTPARATASMNPISWEPLSPIHASARRPGRRLNGRKREQRRGERERDDEDELDGWYCVAAAAKKTAAIAARLAARPSMLSSRLNAFVIPTSQSSPSGIPISLGVRRAARPCPSRGRSPRPRSALRASHARGSEQRSSIRPARKRRVAPGEDADELLAGGQRAEGDGEPDPGGDARRRSPIPPSSGVAWRPPARLLRRAAAQPSCESGFAGGA